MDCYEYYENTVNIEEATKEYESSVYKYKGATFNLQHPFCVYCLVSPCLFIPPLKLCPNDWARFVLLSTQDYPFVFPSYRHLQFPATKITILLSFLLTDERDAIQKKTFTKWVNKHLIKVSTHTQLTIQTAFFSSTPLPRVQSSIAFFFHSFILFSCVAIPFCLIDILLSCRLIVCFLIFLLLSLRNPIFISLSKHWRVSQVLTQANPPSNLSI